METNSPENNWYERILEKPPTYRKRLTFFLVTLIGLLIVTVWLFITSYQIRKAIQGEDAPTVPETDLEETLPPAQSEELPASLQDENEIFKNN